MSGHAELYDKGEHELMSEPELESDEASLPGMPVAPHAEGVVVVSTSIHDTRHWRKHCTAEDKSVESRRMGFVLMQVSKQGKRPMP